MSGRTHTLIIDQREWFVRQTQICYLSQELTCIDTVIAHEWKCSKLPSFSTQTELQIKIIIILVFMILVPTYGSTDESF